MAGVVSIAALARLLSRKRHHEAEQQPPQHDPADELKAKLAAAREPEPPETPAQPEPEPLSIDDRRAQVHEKAQEAIDEMRGPET
jgi:hypothetical protein